MVAGVLEFHGNILLPAVMAGFAAASLYGTMAVALVLTYRMSRTVGFVHGGIATMGAYGYWYLAGNSPQFTTHGLPKLPSLVVVTILGAIAGQVFGSVVTGRMATWPRVTVTTFSLGGMLFGAGVAGAAWPGVFERVASPFGTGTVRVLDMGVTHHQLVVIAFLVVLVSVLTFVLTRTHLGVYVRAIADDIEGAAAVGIPVRRVAVGVWAFSGALAALAGALIVPITNVTELAVIFVLMRSLSAAVLGGFDSLPLALAGAVLFGLVESLIGGSVFGVISSGAREVILTALLLGAVVLIARRRATPVQLLEV
jgi:branched-subunit amino acid ABC-type transport system permease component